MHRPLKIVLLSALSIFATLLISLLYFYNEEKTSTGDFLAFSGYLGLLFSSVVIIPFVYAYSQFSDTHTNRKDDRSFYRRKFERYLSDLFIYSNRSNYDDKKLDEAAEGIVHTTREFMNSHYIKIKFLYREEAAKKLKSFIRQLREYKHSNHGITQGIISMSKDLNNGRVDNPANMRAVFSNLRKDKHYSNLASDLYVLICEIF